MARIKIDSTTYKDDQTVDDAVVEIIIGDDKQPDFQPQVKLAKQWAGGALNESNFSVRLIDPDGTNGASKALIEQADKVRYTSTSYESGFYTKTENESFEFEVKLYRRPLRNRLNFSVRSKGLRAYYQPPLTQWDIDRGDYREPNVTGSYALYHATRRDHALGQANYRAGKAFHIYRPELIDAKGRRIYADLSLDLDAETMSIDMDGAWLDAAAYPVIVDPDFGVTTDGTTNGAQYGSWGSFAFGAPASGDGTLDSVTFRMRNATGITSRYWKGGVWVKSSYAKVELVEKEHTSDTTAWVTFTLAGTESLTDGTDYTILVTPSVNGGFVRYDNSGADSDVGGYIDGITYATLDGLTSPYNEEDRAYSAYATYTPDAGAVLAASVSTTVTVSGALSVPKPLAGSVSTPLTIVGALDVPKPLAASLSVPISVTADLTIGGAELAASVALNVTTAGALSVAHDLAASVSSSVAVTGALTVPKPLAASVSSAVTVTGALDVPKPLAASVSVPIAVSADLTAPGAGAALASSVSSSVTVSGALDVPKPLAASVAVPLSVTADLTIGGAAAELAASVSVPVTVSAALTVAHDLAASVSVPITATADLTAGIALAASVSVPITASADLVVPKPMAASVSSAITVSADLTAPGATAALASTVSLPITVVGALDVPKPLAATVSLPVTASANLTAPDAGADLSATVSVTLSTEGLLFLPSTLVVEDRDLLWLSTARQAKSISTNRDISQI